MSPYNDAAGNRSAKRVAAAGRRSAGSGPRQGARVKLLPHLDLFMRGAVYGTVTRTTPNGVWVRLDRLTRPVLFRDPADQFTVM